MQAVVIAIIAAVVGLCIGYFTWGAQSMQATKDVAAAKAKLEEVRKAAEREGEIATKLQAAETQLKQSQEALKTEMEQTKKLETILAKRKKK